MYDQTCLNEIGKKIWIERIGLSMEIVGDLDEGSEQKYLFLWDCDYRFKTRKFCRFLLPENIEKGSIAKFNDKYLLCRETSKNEDIFHFLPLDQFVEKYRK
mmetsp:Transcript_19810/g.16973  ORF Transcript_19810/g.16973 Transcript_19810/m.16973 type:complete len:101 (-) Transcript_19810:232-534(-)